MKYKVGDYTIGDFTFKVCGVNPIELRYKKWEIDLYYSKSMKKLLFKIFRVPLSNYGCEVDEFNEFNPDYTEVVDLDHYAQGIFYLPELKSYVLKHPLAHTYLFIADKKEKNPFYLHDDEEGLSYHTKPFNQIIDGFTAYRVTGDRSKLFRYKLDPFNFDKSGWTTKLYNQALKEDIDYLKVEMKTRLPWYIYSPYQLKNKSYIEFERWLLDEEHNTYSFDLKKLSISPEFQGELWLDDLKEDVYFGVPGISTEYPINVFSDIKVLDIGIDLYTGDLYGMNYIGRDFYIFNLNPDYTIKSPLTKFTHPTFIVKTSKSLHRVFESPKFMPYEEFEY